MPRLTRLIGTAQHADGKPFTGVLRLRCMSSNSLMQVWRNLRVYEGAVEDCNLQPGLYEVQWLDAAPEGFVPSEEWCVPEQDEIDVNDLRDRHAVPSLLDAKNAIVRSLQLEIERLRAELAEARSAGVKGEDSIAEQIRRVMEG